MPFFHRLNPRQSVIKAAYLFLSLKKNKGKEKIIGYSPEFRSHQVA